MKTLLVASGNKNKLREIAELLRPLNIEVESLKDYPQMPETVEDGKTFTENAIKKAKEASAYTGVITLADDSGLAVNYLEGRPGVYSARFAGAMKDDLANNQKLLQLMKNVPQQKRQAAFICVMAICTPEGKIYTTEGRCDGYILEEPRGIDGFGYDPLFYFTQYDKTFAELDMGEKNQVSHRGKALKGALEILGRLVKGE